MALISLDERLEQLRLELHELSIKQGKLIHFIGESPYFKELSKEEQTLLQLQDNAMCNYMDILVRRIDLFIENNINHLTIK